MAAHEMERVKQLLPKISARLADKTERLEDKMKELQLFKDDVDIFQTLAESNNFEILEYLKETLRIEGHEKIVREIESKLAPKEDCTDKASSSVNNSSDIFCDDSEHRPVPEGPTQGNDRRQMESLSRNVDEMRKDMGEVLRCMKQIGEEFREHKEEARKREESHWERIIKIEKEKDELRQSLEKKEAAFEILQKQFQGLEDKYNLLREEMTKKEIYETAFKQRNKQLEKEIQELKQKLIDMKKSTNDKGKLYNKLMTPRNFTTTKSKK
ncbi:hypothetical protein CHS0354_038476 [Potamilus streckersoni]|uniref:Uncharacterized protein n=1 Tax=Potamilus streckersoni TaxID=2493646 RepID=A0AAE0S609_9BIVA|nr:hypothetical protein CHS0354_038476 [Potamilus streckersoni]